MKRLCDSISEYGILTPLMARPGKGGGYEIVSGHRRKAAAEILGLDKLPVLVRDMTDDEAVVLMIDSNIQRENLLPSEKAFAYKMKLEAMKHQGVSCGQVGLKSRETISEDESGRTIQRYIRLTELVKPILDLVDNKRIAFSPAVELSYLTKEEQAELWDIIQREDCTPSLSQAVRMKKLSQGVKLTPEVIYAVMSEEKANQKPQVRISAERLEKYFPKGYSAKQMEDTIIELLEERQRKKQRGRDSR
jgi:ParB family chromosome partitioning protein